MEPENTEHITSEQTEKLISVLEDLESLIKKQTSLRFALLKGMIYGLGTVIGASVLVAIFGSMLASLGII